MQRALIPAVVLGAFLGGWLARPLRWEVEGVSMAPGLMPGDVAATGWLSCRDRWWRPRRFERWALRAPDGSVAVKRVWGLPGEEIAIVEGDLLINGEPVVKPPPVMADVALPVDAAVTQTSGTAVGLAFADPVLDDVPFAEGERRLLVPVRDIGVMAVIRVGETPHAGEWAIIDVRVADRSARARLHRPGRHTIVAGRLDGAFVAAAWRLEDGRAVRRSCLPAGAPDAWSVSSPWRADEPVMTAEVRVVASGTASPHVTIEHVVGWRDVHHLPPVTGTSQWLLGRGAYFVLGDFPAGSRDSRQWGSIDVDLFDHRLASP